MDLDRLHREHLRSCLEGIERSFASAEEAGERFDSVVLHAGAEMLVHADDQPHLFRPHFHFARLAPLDGADHLVVVRRGRRPQLWRVVPRDYWYEAPREPQVDLSGSMEVHEVESVDDAVEAIGPLRRGCFVGDDFDLAAELGIAPEAVEPAGFMAALDFERGTKTEFEVHCLREAARRAAVGHAAVREAATELASERQLHLEYLRAAALVENEVPYPNIIGWDANAAVLHYQSKDARRPDPGGLLLIDAGASYLGYASDITRTYPQPSAPRLLAELVERVEALQRELVSAVAPKVPYPDLHARAHAGIAEILVDCGILRTSVEEALEHDLTSAFFPHGLGHPLGLQVHDVGGRQVDARGTTQEPPARYPHLRTTRTLEPGHVVTVEPGLYFIPLLLEPLRRSTLAARVDFATVDALTPFGGIRIEDDVLVTATGQEDLTRPFVPGHLD